MRDLQKSNRGIEFEEFVEVVSEHIENYTVPQYGDAPDDLVEEWTPSQCMDSVKRYANRINSNRRGRIETLRDMLKVAHFACLAFNKFNPTEEEIILLMNGGV